MQIQGDNRDNVRQCCIKVKVNIFRANLFLSFLSCEDQTVFYAIYNLSSLVFFGPFNDGWHEQDLNKEWNPNVSRGGVSLKFRFRAVSYLSWLGSGWVFWDPKSKTFGTQKNWEFLFPKCGISQKVEVLRPKCALDFILVPRSRGYTWSSLHKWRNTVVSTVYIRFVCFLLYTRITNVYKALGNGSIWFTVTFWVNLRAWTMTAL